MVDDLLDLFVFLFTPPPPSELSTLSLHDALPIWRFPQCEPGDGENTLDLEWAFSGGRVPRRNDGEGIYGQEPHGLRSEEHTSELQSRGHLVCRLLLEKKKNHLLLH